jgi:hypothetical protein
VILYQRFYPTKLDRAKAEISSESYWSEPELRGKIVAIYVHVRRLTRLVAVKIEAVRVLRTVGTRELYRIAVFTAQR